MSTKNKVSCDDIMLLYELTKEIIHYQGVSGSKSLFGLKDNFPETIDVASLSVTKKPNWILITGKTSDYDFEINKFGNTIKIERHSNDCNIDIIRFVDKDSNVRTNSTITNYKTNNSPISKTRSIRGKGNATLLCDKDGNFISEEQFWQIYEAVDGSQSFKPYVRHEILQAIDNEIVLSKNHVYYYDDETISSKISYRRNVIQHGQLQVCADISETIYCELLEEFSSSKNEEVMHPKPKLKDKIFKHKAYKK